MRGAFRKVDSVYVRQGLRGLGKKPAVVVREGLKCVHGCGYLVRPVWWRIQLKSVEGTVMENKQRFSALLLSDNLETDFNS